MPYSAKTDLPDPVKKLSAHEQDIWLKAFNAAYDEYGGDEEKAHATAWAAVNKAKETTEKAADGPATNGRLSIFAPFSKVTATADGGREVWGFAALEVPDKQSEMADYESTLDQFRMWSEEIQKASQGKSLGNVREMHQLKAVGKVVDWYSDKRDATFEDKVYKDAQGIYVGVKVPAGQDDVIQKIDEGILTGFSIGGKYKRRWLDPALKVTRYTPIVQELSLVDNPATPGAYFDVVKISDTGETVIQEGVEAPMEGDQEKDKEARAPEGGTSNPETATATATAADDKSNPAEKAAGGLAKDVSFEQLKDMIRAKLPKNPLRYGETDFWIVATYPDRVIIENYAGDDPDMWAVPYAIQGEDVVLGQPVQVEVQYVPKGQTPAASPEPEEIILQEAARIIDLAKAGRTLSAANVDRIHKALTGVMEMCGGAGCEKCNAAMKVYKAEGMADHMGGGMAMGGDGQGQDAEKAAHAHAHTVDLAELAKTIDLSELAKHLQPLMKSATGDTPDSSDSLTKAVEDQLNSRLSTLAKAEDVKTVSEDVAKAAGLISQLEGRVKKLEDAPAPGGPIMRASGGPAPDLPAGMSIEEAQEIATLQKMVDGARDAVTKDVLGRELAVKVQKLNQRAVQVSR